MSVVAGGVDVRGQVRVLGDSGLNPSGYFNLTLPEEMGTGAARLNENGSFTIPNVIDGVWRVQSSDLPKNLALFDVRQGTESVYEDGFIVSNRTPDLIQIILSPVGAIHGIVRGEQQQPVPGAPILLLPSAPNEGNTALIRRTMSDAAGQFTIPSAASGDYQLYAFDPSQSSVEHTPDSNAALRIFLEPYSGLATPTTVTAGGNVDVSLQSLKK